MADYTDFEQYARDLYLNATDVEFDATETVHLAPTDFMSRSVLALELFSDAHVSKIRRALKRSLPGDIQSDEDFMRFVIPKCLNLIDDGRFRYFYSFMLVAAFIQEVQSYLSVQKRCYRFALCGYKCLVAVFKRKFEEGFAAHDGFVGFNKYFKLVLKAVENRRKNYRLITLLNGCRRELVLKVADLIRNCTEGGSNQDFVLNDYERSVAEDVDATKAEWFRLPTAEEREKTEEFERDLVEKGKSAMLKSILGIGGTESSSADSPSSIEDSADFKPSTSTTAKAETSDSEVDTSDSESDHDVARDFENFGFACYNFMKPDDFDRLVSSRECKFCGTYCYQYGVYKFRKYSTMARWLGL